MGIEDLIRTGPVDTVLMVYDVVKYTTYCDHHESRGNYGRVHDLIQTVIAKGNGIIRDFGGHPRTFTGDGFISSFDGNVSEKAIDAALFLHYMAQEVRRNFDGGRNPKLKVALYRGPTLFGDLDSAIRPIGRAPCKLFRIEGFAEPGETLASGSVIYPVIDLYDVEERQGIHLRGIAVQKRVYSVLGKKTLEQDLK